MAEKIPGSSSVGLFDNFRVKLLGACATAMTSMESLCVMFLLCDTSLMCNWVEFYQIAIIPAQIVAAFVISWVSGLLTDQTANYAHWVLQGICLVCIGVDASMFLFGAHHQYLVLALFIVRYSTIIQLGNSVGKVLKMHLTATRVPEAEQLPIFNNVTIVGDVVGRFYAVVLAFSIPVILIQFAPGFVSFDLVKYIAFGVIFSVDCFAFTASLFIQRSYLFGTEDQEEGQGPPTINEYVGGGSAPLDDQTPLTDSIPQEKDPFADVGFCTYLWLSCKGFFGASFLWTLTFQIVLIQLANAFVQIVLRFNLAEGRLPPGEVPSPINYCGGLMTNILIQDAMTDAVRIGAAIFYHFFLLHLRPLWYFTGAAFGFMAVLCGLTGMIYWDTMPPVLSSVILAFMIAICYVLLTYSNNTISAIVPSEIYGFTFAVQGSVTIMTGLFPVGISMLKLPTWANATVLMGVLGGTILWAVLVLFVNLKQIKQLDLD